MTNQFRQFVKMAGGMMCFLLGLSACGSDDGIRLDNGEQLTVAGIEIPSPVEHCVEIEHTFTLNGKNATNYIVNYDTINYIPRWVAFKFYKDINQSTVKRVDNFINDPLLHERFHLTDNVHFTPYQRGHLCASADRLVTREANEQTFYFTNMSPQMADFNEHIWAALEGQVRTWRSRFDTLYVVRGGVLPANGNSITVSGKKMAVPSRYYMALLGRSGNNFSAIAFCLDHKAYGGSSNFTDHAATISKAAMSIDDLEKLTGIDFFPRLPDELEKVIENSFMKSSWYGLK